jgi:hypothetical protein
MVSKTKARRLKRGKGIGGVTAYEILARGVREDGAVYWRFVEYLGNQRKKTLEAGFHGVDAAERRASELHATRDEERKREDAVRAAQQGRTVADLLRRWIAAVEGEARRTKDLHVAITDDSDAPTVRIRRKRLARSKTEDRRATRGISSQATVENLRSGAKFVIRLVGQMPVDEPDAAMDELIDGYVKECGSGRRVSQIALEQYTGNILRRAYLWGVANGLCAAAPDEVVVADREVPEDYAFEKWTPERDEARRLIAGVFVVAAKGGKGRARTEGGRPRPWGPPQVLLTAGSGARPIDLARTTVGGVDLDACCFESVRKGGKTRLIAFHENVAPVLRQWLQGRAEEEALFPIEAKCESTDPDERARRDAGALSRRVAKLLRDAATEAGLTANEAGDPVRVTSYSLRRYVVDEMVDITPANVYGDQLGHGSAMTPSYRKKKVRKQRHALQAARLLDFDGEMAEVESIESLRDRAQRKRRA